MGNLISEYTDVIGPTKCDVHDSECGVATCQSREPDHEERTWLLAAWALCVGFTAMDSPDDPMATQEWILSVSPQNQSPWSSAGLHRYAADMY